MFGHIYLQNHSRPAHCWRNTVTGKLVHGPCTSQGHNSSHSSDSIQGPVSNATVMSGVIRVYQRPHGSPEASVCRCSCNSTPPPEACGSTEELHASRLLRHRVALESDSGTKVSTAWLVSFHFLFSECGLKSVNFREEQKDKILKFLFL